MELSGSLGYAYSGYQLAVRLGRWQLHREKEVIGAPSFCAGGAELLEIDEFWGYQIPTKLVLRLGNTWWIWSDPSLIFEDKQVKISVIGEPRLEEGRERYGS